jgi:long-chain fatty acid transport protein
MRMRLLLAALMVGGIAQTFAPSAGAQGIVVPGVGPINRSMAGTATAAPLDAAGAIHWNPATMSALPSSEVVIGFELLYLSTHVETAFGSTRSDSGVSPLPTLAIAWQPEDSPWTFGLGLFTIGGFGTNYALDGNTANLAFEPIFSRLQILQLVPSASLKLTDQLSIGLGATVSMADASLDFQPAVPAPLTHGPMRWGGGFNAGVYYETDSHWNFGLSYKSPQWFEDFEYNTAFGPLTLNIEYPAIYSAGVSYTGFSRLVWALDLRYLDYANAAFFGPSPLAGGLGWDSVFSVSTGVQYQWNDAWSFRLGYIFNENPVPDEYAYVNIPAAAIYQHIIAIGATWRVTSNTSFSIAYLRAFENSITGDIPFAPGFTVTNRQTIDALVAGLEVKF